jgi:uncharacterized damage-inducible protein DinB
MKKAVVHFDRRNFIKSTTTLTVALTGLGLFPLTASCKNKADKGINIIGPIEGYTPQIGTLVSMMNWMRSVVQSSVDNMSIEQLDYLHDSKSNSIGSMLLHLAATEKYYQIHTFQGRKWGSWDNTIKKQWDIPMNLGEEARKKIKGNQLDYYLNTLREVRAKTLEELKKRDDKWLMAVDKEWGWGQTNNYCKWFHVCEHESNHNGQIKWIKSRLTEK